MPNITTNHAITYTNWRALFFFHLIFFCANIFLHFARPHPPIGFLMVRPLVYVMKEVKDAWSALFSRDQKMVNCLLFPSEAAIIFHGKREA